MTFYERVKRWLRKRLGPTEIDRVTASMYRLERELAHMWNLIGDGEFIEDDFYPELQNKDEKLKRVKAWLIILLRRRGRPADLLLALRLEKEGR